MSTTPHISYTETYSVTRDGLADLALPADLSARLADVLDEDDTAEIDAAVTAKIQEHGVNVETGEWYGVWSAEDIVRDILDRHEAMRVVTYAHNGIAWEAIDVELVAVAGADLDNAELSAHDLGCKPGTAYKVALVDAEDREIRSVEITAN